MNTAKVLVTGVNGQLGHDVVKELTARKVPCIGVDISDFDLTDSKAVSEFVNAVKPVSIVHCAAYTAVDAAQDNEELCRRVNVDGTANIAAAAQSVGAKLVYISTDYVYGGDGSEPFTPDSPKNPKNVYGKTKLLGEQAAKDRCSRTFIIRTSWVYGLNGGNFVKTMLRLADTHNSIKVVCDQIGSPTYTVDLSKLICDMLETDKYGEYHGTNEGWCSWADFAKRIMELGGKSAQIIEIPTSEYPAKAVRPFNSRLSKACLDDAGFSRLPSWENALERYMVQLRENGELS